MEATLLELAKWGPPSLHQFDDGRWHCRVNMRVNATGVTFEVKATEATASAAISECLKRVNSVVSELGGNSLKRLS